MVIQPGSYTARDPRCSDAACGGIRVYARIRLHLPSDAGPHVNLSYTCSPRACGIQAILLLLASVLTPTLVRAQQTLESQALEQQGLTQAQAGWSGTIGAGLALAARYPGADSQRLRPVPLVAIDYDDRVSLGPLGIGIAAVRWNGLRAGRLGPLEWIFNTPAHHRVHHASNGEYLDRNYRGILIVWDRLFGTFAAERPETPLVYGLVHPLRSLNPLTIAFHEWLQIARDFRRARSWRLRLRQLFGRPGGGLLHHGAYD